MLLTTYNVNPCSNATAASTLSTLANCSASIGEGCMVPPLDTATLASCQASLQAVADKSVECYNLLTETNAVSCRSFGSFGFLWVYSNFACQDVSAACTCYAAAATLVEETKLLKCSAKESFNTVKASKSNCLEKFSVGL